MYEYSFLVRHQYYHLFKICFSTVLYRLGNLSWSLIHCTVHISKIFRCFTVQCTLYIPKLCRFLDLQQPVPKCILTSALKHGAKAWQNLWSSNIQYVSRYVLCNFWEPGDAVHRMQDSVFLQSDQDQRNQPDFQLTGNGDEYVYCKCRRWEKTLNLYIYVAKANWSNRLKKIEHKPTINYQGTKASA